MSGGEFDWDDAKADANFQKHAVRFSEAQWVFSDTRQILKHDEFHSTDDEDRWILLGLSDRGRLLVVVHTETPKGIRIISARKATKHEAKQYHKRDG